MLDSYPTIIWDCDGVVLNSNNIKTTAFRSVTLPFGELASLALVDFHMQNGGISRYAKFEYFVDFILPVHAPGLVFGDKSTFLQSLLSDFADEVKLGLLKCDVAPGLEEFRRSMPETCWLIVSGGDQAELREVFDHRGIAQYFDGGIYGSPDDKHTIVRNLLKSNQIQLPGLFLGDSRLDHEVAKAFGLDFIFLNQWTEFADWRLYCQNNRICFVPSIVDFLKLETCPQVR
ncbi:HAD hydrolase-like protein [Alphaproteobacteria bacterium]|nr:HAD hydrolase-like protein [Alphaproteobacteria bacterium]